MLHTERQHQRPESPPWKIRTRPCPFYSSGRCLFSDTCAFRHTVKSPLTPLERPLTLNYAAEQQAEPYDILDDGEYDDQDDEHRPSVPDSANHSRGPSLSNYTISSQETGTVRGRSSRSYDNFEYRSVSDGDTEQDNGLGLSNLHSEDFQEFGLAPGRPSSTLRPRNRQQAASHDQPEIPPYISPTLPLRTPKPAVRSKSSVHHREVSKATNDAQELEVAAYKSIDISLSTPGASSLIKNRIRKNTVSGQGSGETNSLRHTEADLTGSPTITLKSLAKLQEGGRGVDETGVLVTTPPTQLLETPPADYDLESPIRARQRFHRAYQLVTNELRQRVAHLRQSPITPENMKSTSDDSEKALSAATVVYDDPVVDVEEPMQEHSADPNATVTSRSWLKPFRLSTLGTPSPITSSQPRFSAMIRGGKEVERRSLTRPPSPEKQQPHSDTHFDRRKSFEASLATNFASESSLQDGAQFSSSQPLHMASAVSRASTSRSGSIHYIHSPNPARWTPPVEPHPRKYSYTHSPQSTSPARSRKNSRSYSATLSSRPAIATPPPLPTTQPKLFFAIASNQPEEVAKLLAEGASSPNETVGPQDMHALEFAMENALNGNPTDKPKLEEIVTTLLSYGAELPSSDDIQSRVNPLLGHFLEKASRSPMLSSSSSNGTTDLELPLRRAKFTVVGQDLGLVELARAFAAHTRLAQYLSDEGDGELPFVALLTGPSGHGKSLLASKVGSLLGTPSYTINMTLVKDRKILWSLPSCNKQEASLHRTLSAFLSANDGQRTVVVIDEIEKMNDPVLLQSLLVPWETGQLQDSSGEFIDVSKVVWLCTSNIGSDEIIKMLRGKTVGTEVAFDAIMKQARTCLRDTLGASLIARVSVVIPFLPFSWDERMAISSKCLTALQRNIALSDPSLLARVPTARWDGIVEVAARDYLEPEGARSIRRSILREADTILQ